MGRLLNGRGIESHAAETGGKVNWGRMRRMPLSAQVDPISGLHLFVKAHLAENRCFLCAIGPVDDAQTLQG